MSLLVRICKIRHSGVFVTDITRALIGQFLGIIQADEEPAKPKQKPHDKQLINLERSAFT